MTITVKSTGNDSRVILWEQDAAHPQGEVFIVADGRPVEVAPTAAIMQRIRGGVLVEVKADKEPEIDKAPLAPFSDYDDLTAAEIVARIVTMTAEEKAAVLAYEAAHKARKTILEWQG